MKKFTLSLSIIITSLHLYAQGTHLPLGNEAYHILDRLEIKSGVPSPVHSSLKYYTRGAVTRYASMLDTMNLDVLSLQDRQDLLYIFKDNNEWLVPSEFYTTLAGKREKITIANQDTLITQAQASMQDPRYIQSKRPILKYFYKTPANLLEVNDKYFYLRVNPILNINLSASNEEPSSLYYNQRGVELRAGVDDRVYFYFNILETQARFPQYVNDRITRDRSIPGNGFYKNFDSNLFGEGQAYDFLNSQGYLGFNITRHIGGQFGYGRNFVGNGYRSLLLSDFGNNYLYFKLNWNVWRFHYQNLFTELSLQSARDVPGEELVPKKYMAAHHLSFNVTKNFNIGLFETVIFSRNKGFELQYLNPIILYRTIEQAFGSPDNVLVGIDAKWNLFKRIQLYGQLMMDEFKFNELFVERNGWWANKFGVQLGAKYIDALGIDHLDLQAEFNIVRPYTYTHTDSLSNYTHYNQTLAHPLGANFREVILLARYQPIQKLTFEARIISANMGEDAPGMNWGNNILLANRTRFQDYGNEIGQGVAADIRIIRFDASYQLFHNVFLDLNYFRRKKTSEDPKLSNSLHYFTGGIRMNIARNRMDF